MKKLISIAFIMFMTGICIGLNTKPPETFMTFSTFFEFPLVNQIIFLLVHGAILLMFIALVGEILKNVKK